MSKVYRIKDWDKYFENNKSRTCEKKSWSSIPNKQDGLGYGRLLRMPNGPSLYGAFVAVVLAASKQKCPRQGHLTDTGLLSGCPLTAHDLSIKTQFPADIIQAMLEACCSELIGWIEKIEDEPPVKPPKNDNKTKQYSEVSLECPPSALQVPAECPSSIPMKEGGKEWKDRKEPPISPTPPPEPEPDAPKKPKAAPVGAGVSVGIKISDEDYESFLKFWEAYPHKVGKQDALKSFAKAIKLAPIETMLAAIEKAKQSAQWTKDGGRFIPHPSTWLNQGRWDDQPIDQQSAEKKYEGGF